MKLKLHVVYNLYFIKKIKYLRITFDFIFNFDSSLQFYNIQI